MESEGQLESVERFRRPTSATLDVDIDDKRHVHRIWEPDAVSSDEMSYDVVAVHGHSGHWKKSWTSPTTEFFWLRDELPKAFPACRILSYGSDDIAMDIIETTADGILGDLLDERIASGRSDAGIVFIGLSLGGMLVKQLFIASSTSRNSRPDIRQFHQCIKGFVFLGSIHEGEMSKTVVQAVTVSARIANQLMYAPSQQNLANALKDVPRINSDFKMLWGEKLPIRSFYETKATRLWGSHQIIVPQHSITIKSDVAEDRPLDKTHANMGKFDGPGDPSLSRVLGSMRRLFDLLKSGTGSHRSVETEEASAEVPPPLQKVRILSLDGGGVRGVFTIIVLEKIMEEIRRLDRATEAPKPCQFFEIIGGTSTGGLLAVMLGRLKMDIYSCKKAYKDLSKRIFTRSGINYPFKEWIYAGWQWVDSVRGVPWYSGEVLVDAIKDTVRERLDLTEKEELDRSRIAHEDAPLLSRHVARAGVFVCAGIDNEPRCERLRSYISNSGQPGPAHSIWQACRATSAAPLYFPPAEIGTHRYYDGGTESNNPILETIEEAFLQHGEDAQIVGIVSIGTGKQVPVEPGRNLVSIMRYMAAKVTDTEKKHEDFVRNHRCLLDVYFRFQEPDALGKIDLADWKQIPEIERLARQYLEIGEGKELVLRCACKLTGRSLREVQEAI